MKNPYIIPTAMICATILAGIWMLKTPSEQPQKVIVVQPPPLPKDISIYNAAEKGNIEVVKKHLATGADVNAKDEHNRTPLDWAAVNGRKEIVELLIRKGAEVNKNFGMTPLHLAAAWSHKEVIELLIDGDADVNAQNDSGETPLDIFLRNVAAGITEANPDTSALLRKHGGKSNKYP